LFVNETGYTISDYIIMCKCDRAKFMLVQSDASCTDIAAFFGFSSGSYFTKRFRELTGETPTEYRVKRFGKLMSNDEIVKLDEEH
jgi:AraC-like DNA-binding protein